jgi:hypothetical protein
MFIMFLLLMQYYIIVHHSTTVPICTDFVTSVDPTVLAALLCDQPVKGSRKRGSNAQVSRML